MCIRSGHLLCSMESGRKRRKVSACGVNPLSDLLHVGGVSTTGLAKLLDKLKGVNLKELAATDWKLREANLEAYRRLQHTEAMPLTSGGVFDWEVLHPNSLLQEMVERSSAFRSHVIAAFRRCPPTAAAPWSLVVGFDEFTPGLRSCAWGFQHVAAQPLRGRHSRSSDRRQLYAHPQEISSSWINPGKQWCCRSRFWSWVNLVCLRRQLGLRQWCCGRP